MKKLLCLIVAAIMVFVSGSPAFAAEEQISLASGGSTEYRIVISANASETEKTAADTLARYLGQITSAEFPVVSDKTEPSQKEIAVGDTNRKSHSVLLPGGADSDSVRILTDGKKLYLAGGAERGTLYAVYTFLEDWLGCRWFTHDLTVVPKQKSLSIPFVDYFYEPCFKLRQTYWLFSTAYSDYCAEHKLHGIMAYMPENMGGGRYDLAISSVHTMQAFVPQSLFETHPEYFGCDENGTRSPQRQPCLRNDDVFSLALGYARDYFAKYSAVLSVSQNDCMDFCQCDKCKEFNVSHGGTDSAALLDFVNRLATEIKKEYPDARIETLAYQRSQTPPEGLIVEDNVVIRLCPISTCTLHRLDDPSCPPNAAFDKDLSGWSEIAKNIYIWDYSTDFQYYYALFPNITSLQERYRYYRDHNVVSIFDHGCGENIVPGEFHELRTYLVLKLLWNPDTDIDRHISEFCNAYYGAAGDDISEFISYYEQNIKGFNIRTLRNCHNSCQDGGISILNNSSLSSGNVRHLDSIIKKAQSRELSEEESYRLQGVSLSWRFFKNATFSGEFNWISGFTNPETATKQLVSDMREYGIVTLSENSALYLHEEEPDYRMMPTFWYTDENELANDILTDMKFRVFANSFLRTICAPLRTLFNIS